jgi:nucleoid DNA-binding protein
MPEKKNKPRSKSALIKDIAEKAGVEKKQAEAVYEALMACAAEDLGKDDPGCFVLPGLVKIERKHVPARPAQKGVPNPFKPGETMDVDARPESWKIKVRPLKGLKDMVA